MKLNEFKIGSVYSIIKNEEQLTTYKLNDSFYMRYGVGFENCLYLGDIGIQDPYGFKLISFLIDNKILSFFSGTLESLNVKEVI